MSDAELDQYIIYDKEKECLRDMTPQEMDASMWIAIARFQEFWNHHKQHPEVANYLLFARMLNTSKLDQFHKLDFEYMTPREIEALCLRLKTVKLPDGVTWPERKMY